jgi:hypothetical protein
MHKHKLHYDVQTGQLKIASMDSDQIVAIKELVLPALTSFFITIKHKGHVDKNSIYIASITAPRVPFSSGNASHCQQ